MLRSMLPWDPELVACLVACYREVRGALNFRDTILQFDILKCKIFSTHTGITVPGGRVDKWADYCITRARYDRGRTNVVEVLIHEDLGERIGHGYRRSRAELVAAMKGGKRVVTVKKNPNGRWRKVAEVNLFRVRGGEYVRAYGNAKDEDNLGALPEL